ncbi:SET domain-containing protein [Legionella genomosp. 1]|uniref:SET domain-containing protein n=1 Tax=Legionella genomosp. 1 TaxID=1093625 RepID=UPI0010568403|nr:SET domain-containing protein [Legionella genomosp. 1]
MYKKFESNLGQILSEKPQKINISNKLPSQPDCEIKQVESDVLAKEIGMKAWTDSLVFTKDTQVLAYPEIENAVPHYDDAAMSQLLSTINSNSKKLCLSPMGATGLGVFALEVIEPGEPVIIYAGSMKPMSPGNNVSASKNDYGLDFDNFEGQTYAIIQAKNYGNLARCMQHAPRKTTPPYADHGCISLDDYHFLDIDRNTVAVANLELKMLNHRGQLIYYFIAKERILPGHIVVWDYNIHYWRTKEAPPELFTKHGEIIDRKSYRPKAFSVRISFDNGDKPIDLFTKASSMYFDSENLQALKIQTPYGDRGYVSAAEIKAKFDNSPLLFIWRKSYNSWIEESRPFTQDFCLIPQDSTQQFFKPSRSSRKEILDALKQLAKEYGMPKAAQYDLRQNNSVAIIMMDNDSHKTEVAAFKAKLTDAGIRKTAAGFATFGKERKYCLYIYEPSTLLFKELTKKLQDERTETLQQKFHDLSIK